MISINGLTERQRSIMDLLWGCNSLEQVQVLIKSLPTPADQMDAKSLVLIATWESIEQELGLSDYEHSAQELISRISHS